MSTPFLGEIKMLSFAFPPKGWAFCNGQLLPINQNQALFSLLGTTYGGDGQTNFALPNLQGRVPLHTGAGFTQGQVAGETAHTITVTELPAHTHVPAASSTAAAASNPVGDLWADGAKAIYNTAGSASMAAQAVANTGGSQAHDNMSPYLVLNFCIALQGIFPSQS